jgi:hypothetical protein
MALPRCGQSKHFACPCARRVLGERPAQKDCRFLLRVRCPPTAFPAAPSPRTETSARPVSKSSSKQDYTIQRPSKRPHIGRGAAQTIRPKPVTPMSESGQNRKCLRRRGMSALPPTADIGTPTAQVRFVPIGDIALAFLTTEESATEKAISKCPGQCRGFEDFDISVVD